MFFKRSVPFLILLFLLAGVVRLSAQAGFVPADTLGVLPVDTLVADTAALNTDTVARKKSGLEAPVSYQAADSIVMLAGNLVYLYGQSEVKYQQIELQSERIEMNMDSSLVYAIFGTDTVGDEFGYPLFVDGDQQVEARTMRYNFKTRKAFVKDVLTQQGEGFLTADVAKKMPDDAMNMLGGKYTTCDEHDHPHFYIRMTKVKVRPGKNIVAGPSYLVVEDVPLYLLGLPFGFFPFTDTYSSGVIMPTYGDEMTHGFFLREGGYYFALSDYADLAVTGDLYTKGSWGAAARSAYRKRYKYSGAFNVKYQKTITGDKDAGDQSKRTAFSVTWSHTQDQKANPYRTLSASINYASNQFDRNEIRQQANMESTQNNKGSSISLSQRFPNSPWSLSSSLNINQRSSDSSVYINFPNMLLNMSRIYPLKRKHAVGADKWFEKISLSYTGSLQNSLTAKENEIFQSSSLKAMKSAMDHKIPVSATYTAFGYLNVSPSFNYHERWHSKKIYQAYDTTQHRLVEDSTAYGFHRVWDYNASLSASTTLYGFFKPWRFLFGDLVEMIRHRAEPNVSISYTPNRGDSYYRDVNFVNQYGNLDTISYAFFDQVPSRYQQGNLSFGLNNNIEAKVRSNKDSTGVKKISLIDNLSFGMSYNMLADSIKWSDLTVGLRIKFSQSYTLNLTGIFDTYVYDYDEKNKRLYKIDQMRLSAGKGLGRLKSTGSSFSYTFNNDTFKKWFGGEDAANEAGTGKRDANNDSLDDADADTDTDTNAPQTPTPGKRLREPKRTQTGDYDYDGYYLAKIPWSLSFNYNLSLGYGGIDVARKEYKYVVRHGLSFNGNIQPTKNWRMNFNASYDFELKKIPYMTLNISRDLHCFQMTASVIPVGYRKSYMFSIAVNSSMLKDLKYNQSSSYRDALNWY